jgi:hypothetical protein
MAKNEISHTFGKWFQRSGWFFLLLGIGGMIYFYAIKQKSLLLKETTLALHLLEKQKLDALSLHEELLLQIQSQSDPAWIEMVLKRNLGMISEGQIKVYFE